MTSPKLKLFVQRRRGIARGDRDMLREALLDERRS